MTPEPNAPAEPTVYDLLWPVALIRRIAHFLIYGDAGTFKSTFVTTMPWPILVFAFDTIDKLGPYFRAGRIGATIVSGDLMGYPEGTFFDVFGTPVIPVWHPTEDRIIILIEHYIDNNPYQPDAYARYERRMKSVDARPGGFRAESRTYGTVCWDSITFFGMARRKLDEFVRNATTKSGATQDGKQWYGAEANAVENEILRRAALLPTNVAAIAHVSDEKVDLHGVPIYTPATAGKRLPRRMPPGFGEVYLARIEGNGPSARPILQTRGDALYVACTQIPAPNPCVPDYNALWPEGT